MWSHLSSPSSPRGRSHDFAAEHHELMADHLIVRAMSVSASGRYTHRWWSAGTCERRKISNMVRSSTGML